MYANARPGGASDDEDFYDDDDYDDYDNPRPIRRHWSNQVIEITPNDRLLDAVRGNDIENAIAALDQNASPDYKRGDRAWTPFMEACHNANYKLVEILLEKGADVNDGRDSFRPIHCLCNASSRDEESIMHCFNLIKHAELDQRDWYGVTPLMLAAKNNHIPLAKELLKSNSINAKNNEGWTAIFYAVDACNIEMINFLKKHKANLKLVDKRDYSIQDIAAEKQNLELEICVSIDKDYDDSYLRVSRSRQSVYQMMISECPDKNKGRLYGFQNTAIQYLTGLEFMHLVDHFEENNGQLGQLLTWNDKELKKIAKFSFDRKKIISCVKELHEGRWENNALVTSSADSIMFQSVKELANLNRVIYILSMSTLYCCKNYGRRSPKLKTDFNKILLNIGYIKGYLEDIRSIAKDINKRFPSKPADYIPPRVSLWEKVKSNTFKYWPHCLLFNFMWILVYHYKRKNL